MADTFDSPDAVRFDDLRANLEVALQIDSVCDAFESQWKQGDRPDLEEYLQSTTVPRQTLFVELVMIDINYRSKIGEIPTLEEYASRFPHLSHTLDGITVPVSQSQETASSISVVASHFPKLGKFELVEKIGEGTFGLVWKARDTRLRRWVALKQFRESMSEFSQKLLLREARAVAQIEHPNVVRIHEVGTLEEQNYVTFEFVSGGNLARWIGKQLDAHGQMTLSPDAAADITIQLTRGLQAIHHHKMIHRDLKSSNILLDEHGVPKIADFGLAQQQGSLTTIGGDGVFLGTIPYMSPEQCHGSKLVTERSDLYSLGIILYELLTGQRPFQGSRVEMIQKIQKEIPVSPQQLNPDVPDSLGNICLRAIAKDPQDRYQSADQMRMDLEAFLRGETIGRTGPSPLARLCRNLRVHWLTVTSVMVLMAGLGALWGASTMIPKDGKKIIKFTTQPPGAKVAFIPLDSVSGLPRPERIVHARGTSPVQVRLPPGDYLVEAYFEGPNAPFHEVYRHVPLDNELLGGALGTFYGGWERDRTNPEVITLFPAKILPHTVTSDMVLVPQAESYRAGKDGVYGTAVHMRSGPAFYMDATEVSLATYQDMFHSVREPDDSWVAPPTRQHALTTKWLKAVWMAERMGKRLPESYEYERAATRNGTQSYSWGNSLPEEASTGTMFQPVGFPRFDRIDYDSPIYGLCSNVAEWTMSRVAGLRHTMTGDPLGRLASMNTLNQIIIRGGGNPVVGGNPEIDEVQRDPRHITHVKMTAVLPGLGFRCVRSSGPRLTPEDFDRPLEEK